MTGGSELNATHVEELLGPTRAIPPDAEEEPRDGVALCLSGGGYRAMLFHAGVLRRLNDAAWLTKLDRISSVSGGSIAAATLALHWNELGLERSDVSPNFVDEVEAPLRELARHNVDVPSVLTGLALPFISRADRVASAYRKHLFGDSQLSALPARPRFIINATNVGSGALARFTRDYLADWRVGRIMGPEIDLAVAVACSSAFPPVLSPYRLDLRDAEWQTERGNDLIGNEHRDEMVLTDGGVYDNLGLETAWKQCRTVLVSDAGGKMAADADPKGDPARHMLRVVKVIDNQVRALRKRQVIAGYKSGTRDGAYVGIRSDIDNYEAPNALPASQEQTLLLAEVPTRLAAVDDVLQERLINWGYAVCDAGLRRWVEPELEAPPAFPYPQAGVG